MAASKSDQQPDEPARSQSAADERQYVIQLGGLRSKPILEKLASEFADLGVRLDTGYRPIPINPTQGTYVVRGWATPQARQAAERALANVQFFGDSKLGPA
jgi:hypothetical protein